MSQNNSKVNGDHPSIKFHLLTTHLFIRIFIAEMEVIPGKMFGSADTIFNYHRSSTKFHSLDTWSILTLWSRFHMDKITLPLLDKKFATSYGNQNPSAHISMSMRTHLGNTPHPPDHSWDHWSLEGRYTCNPAAQWLPGRHPGSNTGSPRKSRKLWPRDSGWHHVPDHDELIQ